MTDIDAAADSIFASFKAYCSAEVQRRMTAALRDLPPGPPGPQGEKGERGERGEAGPAGERGVDGKDGRDGIDGKDGAPGLDGKDGAPGRDGIDGKDGVLGPAGVDGINGKDGAPGRDGIDGKDGRDGIDGKDGAPGPQGERGADGLNGKDGAPGRDGAAGIKGEDGRDGRDGLEGVPGRDALRLDVLDAIDCERSYPRGTYARHEGGVLRATRTTDPIVDGEIGAAGWQVIIDGINEVRFIDVDERTTKLSLTITGGRKVEHVLQFPAVIYRGLWGEGDYVRGDAVTFGGSVWHCERATQAKPETSPDWKLMVKRGRDGDRGEPGGDSKAPPRVRVGGGR